MRGFVILGIVASNLLAVSFISEAANAPPPQCAADISKLCPSSQDSKQTGKCLKQHNGELSSACKGALEEIRTQRKERNENIETACSADITKLCSSASTTKARSCLKQHKNELTTGCLTAITATKAVPQPSSNQSP